MKYEKKDKEELKKYSQIIGTKTSALRGSRFKETLLTIAFHFHAFWSELEASRQSTGKDGETTKKRVHEFENSNCFKLISYQNQLKQNKAPYIG